MAIVSELKKFSVSLSTQAGTLMQEREDLSKEIQTAELRLKMVEEELDRIMDMHTKAEELTLLAELDEL